MRGKEKLGSLSAEYWISNGEAIDGLNFQVNGDEYKKVPKDATETVAVVWINEGSTFAPEWMILVRMRLTASWGGGVKMEWEPGHAPKGEDEGEYPPEAYKKTGCRQP